MFTYYKYRIGKVYNKPGRAVMTTKTPSKQAPASRQKKASKQKTFVESKLKHGQKPRKSTGPASGIKKKYFKTKKACSVTFVLPGLAAPGASLVCIVGDFNNWSINSHPMKRLKSGDFTICLELEPGRHYQYRYLIDDFRWENDWEADSYITNPYGDSENSVVIV